MLTRTSLLSLGLAAWITTSPGFAETVGWRMDGDGRYLDAQPPVAWSKSDNVVWKTKLPSWSNASPVLVGSRIFVLNEPDEIVAVNREDGKTLWQASTGDLVAEPAGAHDANGWTTPTPVSDGAHVFALFGSGVVAAYTVDGERLWARFVEQPVHRWGLSASPVLVDGKLIVHIVDLVALDPKTGEEAWRAESKAAWGSPVTAQVDGTKLVITPSGDVFRASNGERVATGIGRLAFAAPVVQDGVVYFLEKEATAVRLPSQLDEPFETLWTSRIKGSRHYASPVIHDGLVYAVSRELDFSILDAKTGELLHESRLDLDSGSNTGYPSITLAGGKLFLSTENGTTAVLEPGREYKEIARNAIEGFRSSPVFVGQRMFIRAFEHLYCFGAG